MPAHANLLMVKGEKGHLNTVEVYDSSLSISLNVYHFRPKNTFPVQFWFCPLFFPQYPPLKVAEPRRNNEPSSNSQAHAIALLARGLPRGQWQLRYNKPKQDGNNNASGSNRSGASASNSSGSSSGNQSIIQKPGSDFELKKVRRVPSRL